MGRLIRIKKANYYNFIDNEDLNKKLKLQDIITHPQIFSKFIDFYQNNPKNKELLERLRKNSKTIQIKLLEVIKRKYPTIKKIGVKMVSIYNTQIYKLIENIKNTKDIKDTNLKENLILQAQKLLNDKEYLQAYLDYIRYIYVPKDVFGINIFENLENNSEKEIKEKEKEFKKKEETEDIKNIQLKQKEQNIENKIKKIGHIVDNINKNKTKEKEDEKKTETMKSIKKKIDNYIMFMYQNIISYLFPNIGYETYKNYVYNENENPYLITPLYIIEKTCKFINHLLEENSVDEIEYKDFMKAKLKRLIISSIIDYMVNNDNINKEKEFKNFAKIGLLLSLIFECFPII